MFGTEILSSMMHKNLPETVVAGDQQLFFFHLTKFKWVAKHLNNFKLVIIYKP